MKQHENSFSAKYKAADTDVQDGPTPKSSPASGGRGQQAITESTLGNRTESVPSALKAQEWSEEKLLLQYAFP